MQAQLTALIWATVHKKGAGSVGMAPFVLARTHDLVLIPHRSPMVKPLFGHERSLSAHMSAPMEFRADLGVF